MKSNIYPCLWFDHDVKEIADFYSEIFENVKYLDSASMVTTVEIEGVKFMFLNGGPAFKVNPSVSYYVYCQDPDQVQQLLDLQRVRADHQRPKQAPHDAARFV